MKKIIYPIFFSLLFLPTFSYAFSLEFVDQSNYSSYEEAGFFSGIWHGLIAPYSLLVRGLSPFSYTFDVGMYAYSNTGWFYDFGFLVGLLGSLPIGWLAALIAFFALLI